MEQALRLGLLATRGLVAAHEQGIIHRDLKPGGIVVTPEGAPKIADFGLAKDQWSITGNLTGPEETLGTVRYMPPEQVKNARTADHRADIYSLGATLFHALAGKPPYHGRNELELMSAVVSGTLQPFDPTKSGLPLRMAQVIKRCMAPAPEQRYQSASELEHDIGRAISEHMHVPDFQGDPELLLQLKPGAMEATWRTPAAPPTPGGMAGALERDELVEFLQMLGFNVKTGVLTVHTAALSGHLAFQEGRIKAAITNRGHRDQPAALELMASRQGRFEFSPKLPKNFVACIDQDVSAMLMEAMRRRDESKEG
jgi:serine/threonine protein kinase